MLISLFPDPLIIKLIFLNIVFGVEQGSVRVLFSTLMTFIMMMTMSSKQKSEIAQ